MSKTTQVYKRSLSGSVGAGFGSLLKSSGKQYYILEHKTKSKYHRAGEEQEIIVNQIEIGRDPKCQVRFDEAFTTVSRQHAAIVKDGDRWKLIQLSTKNPTLLNGSKVDREWYLRTGDEIQLSIAGPKLGFIVPTGNKSTVGTIGLSRRLTLFRQQALRPYRTSLILLSLLLLLAIGGGAGYGVWQKKTYDKTFADMEAKARTDRTELTNQIDSLKIKQREDSIRISKIPKVKPVLVVADLIVAVKKDVYFIVTRSYIRINGKVEPLETSYGTGFMLKDGYFVTARHCVETWLFDYSEERNVDANVYSTTYPNEYEVYSEISAYSDKGLQFTLKSSDFKINRQDDFPIDVDVDENNNPMRLRRVFPYTQKDGQRIGSETMLANDWACAKISHPSSLVADYKASTSLHAGEEIHVLGFPVGLGVADGHTSFAEPIYNKMSVSRDNLNNAGCIMISQGTDSGNSGGPVFAIRNNRLVVVGIVSRGDPNTDQYNHIVPIQQIKH